MLSLYIGTLVGFNNLNKLSLILLQTKSIFPSSQSFATTVMVRDFEIEAIRMMELGFAKILFSTSAKPKPGNENVS
jgi:hypothetical protein